MFVSLPSTHLVPCIHFILRVSTTDSRGTWRLIIIRRFRTQARRHPGWLHNHTYEHTTDNLEKPSALFRLEEETEEPGSPRNPQITFQQTSHKLVGDGKQIVSDSDPWTVVWTSDANVTEIWKHFEAVIWSVGFYRNFPNGPPGNVMMLNIQLLLSVLIKHVPEAYRLYVICLSAASIIQVPVWTVTIETRNELVQEIHWTGQKKNQSSDQSDEKNANFLSCCSIVYGLLSEHLNIQ